MSIWLTQTMYSTPDFILRRARWHIIGLLYKVQSWRKDSVLWKSVTRKAQWLLSRFRIRIIWIIFISKCRKGILYRLLFSYTQTLNAREKSIVLPRHKPLKVVLRRTRIKTLFPVYPKFQEFSRLAEKDRAGTAAGADRFSFVLWRARTPREAPYCPVGRW